jgi:hypothetical protein
MKKLIYIILTLVFTSGVIVSCKKDKKTEPAPTTPTPTPTYTSGTLMEVTIVSIPNSSTFYEANGADIYWEFICNNSTDAPLISKHNSPLIDVQDVQFPLIATFSTGYPVLVPSGTVTNTTSGTTSNGNYFIKVYDEDVSNDGLISDQYIGMISFTWTELVSGTSTLTKTLNGTSIKVTYTLQ